MRIIFSILIITFFKVLLFAGELEWVDQHVNAIKPPRKGAEILAIKTPFIFLKKNNPKKEDKTKHISSPVLKSSVKNETQNISRPSMADKSVKSLFTLKSIINSSAMINNGWYSEGDKINDYTVLKITENSVILSKKGKKTILSTLSKKIDLKLKSR